ncbi:triose-phosphate isomerase [Acetoanaerobium sticklandii]|uniref:triose-phosphate isomerase n=1 Tax=Acetoanaerobium sticklandii TaxID=1511 RepID=UPI003A8D521D
MRKPIIAGNWKMHKTIAEALEFVEKIKAEVAGTDVETVICTPFTQLKDIKQAVKDTNIKVGAQNMHYEEKGAFTGEISAAMLKELMVDYVIIGHSERRQYFNETDETVNKKVKKALAYEITPIMCVGESLEEREAEKTKEIVKDQTKKGLEGLTNEQVSSLVIAYEPIWAIGTGKTASSQDANEVIAYIREVVKDMYSEEVSEEVRIQYGGSVKPSNVEEIMNESDIDGALVGGASLEASDFTALVNF